MGEKRGLPRCPFTIEHPSRHREPPRNNPSHFPPLRFFTGFSTGQPRPPARVFHRVFHRPQQTLLAHPPLIEGSFHGGSRGAAARPRGAPPPHPPHRGPQRAVSTIPRPSERQQLPGRLPGAPGANPAPTQHQQGRTIAAGRAGTTAARRSAARSAPCAPFSPHPETLS